MFSSWFLGGNQTTLLLSILRALLENFPACKVFSDESNVAAKQKFLHSSLTLHSSSIRRCLGMEFSKAAFLFLFSSMICCTWGTACVSSSCSSLTSSSCSSLSSFICWTQVYKNSLQTYNSPSDVVFFWKDALCEDLPSSNPFQSLPVARKWLSFGPPRFLG